MSEPVDALPTKDLFVHVITRDISLEDAILDLLDNCVDGARRKVGEFDLFSDENEFSGYNAKLTLRPDRFDLLDNCGGIPKDDAKDYAFRFGRSSSAPELTSRGIGLYGIGMKRALFKLGQHLFIHSSTETDAFSLAIDVDDWRKSTEWKFNLDPEEPTSPGTQITAESLYESVSAELELDSFQREIAGMISRDYSLFLQNGFDIYVNGEQVEPRIISFLEGGGFSPLFTSYKDESGVEVQIWAGMVEQPLEDLTEPDPTTAARLNRQGIGWTVSCNERVVLAADRSERTVWGNGEFPRFHDQYRGFGGLLNFRSEDPTLLPWTTTKRDIDQDAALYRRAVAEMKKVTRKWIDYTNRRKSHMEEHKAAEAQASPVPLKSISQARAFGVPTLDSPKEPPQTFFNFGIEKARVIKLKKGLNKPSMSNKELGLFCFEYTYEMEVDE